MPEYHHPRADADAPGHPPAKVHVSRAENADVDADGVFEAPVQVAEAIARQHDTTAAEMRVGGDDEPKDTLQDGLEVSDLTVPEQIHAGECPWCDDYEGDHVAQHASSAHSDEWGEYKGDE